MDDKNYLDFVPVVNEECSFFMEKDGQIIIEIENKGFFNVIAQKIFRRPRFTKVHLDSMGNFIWPHINGENSIYDISLFVKEEFGEKAEPLYNRLVQYFRTLESYGFVRIEK